MTIGGSDPITQLLARWNSGDRDAYDQLMRLVYDELRRLARRIDSGGNGNTLQSTAIVHELYLKLVDSANRSVENRVHFFSLAARAMRQIVIDRARRASAGKRGKGLHKPLDEQTIIAQAPGADVLMLDEALSELETFDARKARMIELRYFVGLTMEEVAAAMSVSSETVRRDLRLAETWLLSYLRPD